MSAPLAGRHALVCGASTGIGRASALRLASSGAEITALARSAERLETLVGELRTAGDPEVLTAASPKTVDDVHAACA